MSARTALNRPIAVCQPIRDRCMGGIIAWYVGLEIQNGRIGKCINCVNLNYIVSDRVNAAEGQGNRIRSDR
jgi:hypothetical protein